MLTISIKSEMDSRCILYPMMRCFLPLGNTLIISSNRYLTRIIDGEFNGYYRNFHIVVEPDGATDDVLEDLGVSLEDYDFVIYDNMGVLEQDKLIIVIGTKVSESFETDMFILGEDVNTHIVRFGTSKFKPPKPPKKKLTPEEIKEEKERKKQELLERRNKKKTNTKETEHSIEEQSDEEVYGEISKRFKPKKVDVKEILQKLPNLKFITFEDIELLESYNQLPSIDPNFIKFFYSIFQSYIAIKEPFFRKEVSKKDAYCRVLERETNGENSVVSIDD